MVREKGCGQGKIIKFFSHLAVVVSMMLFFCSDVIAKQISILR